MKVYHGSNITVAHPDISHSRANLDFGRGFYETTVKDQAENWARRKALRAGSTPTVSVYDMGDNISDIRFLQFENNDEAWLDFVCDCRRGSDQYRSYDLIFGDVANDKVYAAVDLYYRGIWDIQRTLHELKFYDRNNQFCFVTQNTIDRLLQFISSYEVKNG